MDRKPKYVRQKAKMDQKLHTFLASKIKTKASPLPPLPPLPRAANAGTYSMEESVIREHSCISNPYTKK